MLVVHWYVSILFPFLYKYLSKESIIFEIILQLIRLIIKRKPQPNGNCIRVVLIFKQGLDRRFAPLFATLEQPVFFFGAYRPPSY